MYYQIRTEIDYNLECEGVLFKHGIGQTTDSSLAKKFQNWGYMVSEVHDNLNEIKKFVDMSILELDVYVKTI